MRNDFTLFKREFKNHPVVWYYYVYDSDGKRRKFSTGMETKTAATAYCMALAKSGQLIPPAKNKTLFRIFAADFWNEEKSTYLKARALRGHKITKKVLLNRYLMTNKHILPYFGDFKLTEIKRKDIENWLLSLSGKGLTFGTVNSVKTMLNIILNYAVEQEIISTNPCDGITPYTGKYKERGTLSLDEVRKLFHPDNFAAFWKSQRIQYTSNILAAVTGMRLNEIRALQKDDIKDGYLVVSHGMNEFGLKDTKNHKSREIPIPHAVQDMLLSICPVCGGFIFSEDGKNPLPMYKLRTSLKKALEAMGISKEEIERRNICFHSWRHFFNTTLRASGIADSKTQAITGHQSLAMSEHYTHFTHNELKEINQVQVNIIGA